MRDPECELAGNGGRKLIQADERGEEDREMPHLARLPGYREDKEEKEGAEEPEGLSDAERPVAQERPAEVEASAKEHEEDAGREEQGRQKTQELDERRGHDEQDAAREDVPRDPLVPDPALLRLQRERAAGAVEERCLFRARRIGGGVYLPDVFDEVLAEHHFTLSQLRS
jgi:hypothetical protein